MNIAELFVNLGVKGSEKTVGAITNLQKGLKETASTSLEAKAAIVGAMYALERLFATSGKAGTDLTNFNTLMGGGMIQTLQKYQYAARQVGITNEEMEGTFKSLSDLAAKTLLGKARPEGAAYVANRTKTDLNPLLKAAADGHPELLLQKLQQFAQMEKNVGMRNQVLKSFGLGDNMVAGLTRNAFTPQTLAKAPTYSDKEVGALDKANIAWGNLGTKIEMAVGHFNAMHGGKLVKEISDITDKVLSMANAFMKFAETAHAFEAIGKIFEGWGLIFDGITKVINVIVAAVNSAKKMEELKSDTMSFVTSDLPNMFKFLASDMFGDKPEPSATVPTAKTQPAPAPTPEKPKYGDDVFANVKAFNTYQKASGALGPTKAQPGTPVPPKAPPFNLREALGLAPDTQKAPVAPPAAVKAPTAQPAALKPAEPVPGAVKAPVAPPAAVKAPVAPTATPAAVKAPTVAPALRVAPPAPMQLNPQGENEAKSKPETPAQANLRLVVPPSPVAPTPEATASPAVSPALAGAVNNQNINVTQSLNFNHEGKDAARTGDSTKKAVQAAFRQMSAQAQGT